MRRVPVEDLLRFPTSNHAHFPLSPILDWGPVVDGVTVERRPLDAVQQGSFNDAAEVVIGSAKNDGSVFGLALPLLSDKLGWPETMLRGLVDRIFGPAAGKAILRQFPRKGFVLGVYPQIDEIVTDYLFRCSARRFARALASRGRPAWLYEFSYAFQGSKYRALGEWGARQARGLAGAGPSAPQRGAGTPEDHPDGTQNRPGTCVRGGGRLSVQESYEPEGQSFGSGPKNSMGLGLKSFRPSREAPPGTLESEFVAAEHLCGFPGVVCGGVLGVLVESQGNWSAAMALMDSYQLSAPPLTVTKEFQVELHRPAPTGKVLLVTSEVADISEREVRVTVKVATDKAGKEVVCAEGRGTFMKIGPLRSFDIL